MSELVTGEAVVLELRLAKLPSRGLAFGLDLLVQLGALIPLLLIAVGRSAVDDALGAAVLLLIVVATMVGYPVVFETLSRGRTLGKMALGLRVVRDDGGPVRLRHALVRGLTGFFVDFWALGLGGTVAVVSSLASAKGKRVGDLLAGTVVVRERVPVQGIGDFGPPPMPPELAEWASRLELSLLPPGLALAIRQYLVRWRELSEEARHAVGWQLANEVTRFVGQPVPPGMPPATYLAAVLAERHRRTAAGFQPPAAAGFQTAAGVDPDSPFAAPS